MNKKLTLTFLLLGFCLFSFAQDIDYARQVIQKLTSEKMHGRGYVNKGELKAAKFIRKEFKKAGLKSFDGSYFQKFNIPINTITGKLEVSLNGQKLKGGYDYMVASFSPSIKGEFELVYFDKDTAGKEEILRFFSHNNLKDKFLLANQSLKDSLYVYMRENLPAGIIFLSEKKLIWRVSDGAQQGRIPVLYLKSEVKAENIKELKINLSSKYFEQYQTQNVWGYVEGKKHPEKFIFFTAHYDHLGGMGKDVYFPGANDNASGTAMIMDIARFFARAENQADYSIGFIALGAEETGLQGSTYAAENPMITLEKMEFLVNLDMVGSGSDGITIVNGKVLPDAFKVFKEINKEKEYLKDVKARGESCNSDHCMFFKKGVPAVFIYTRGKEFMEYHNPDDRAKDLPLTEYEDLFLLLTDFVKTF